MLSRQPTELDYADSSKFRFKINKLPKLSFLQLMYIVAQR